MQEVSEYKVFRYSRDHPNEIKVSANMNELVQQSFKLIKPNAVISLPVNPAYEGPQAVQSAKIADLKKLFPYLHPETKAYINNLVADNTEQEDDDEA